MKNKLLTVLTFCFVIWSCTGEDGIDGIDGTNGIDGNTYIARVTDETAGANCPSGGLKVEIGADINANTTLEDSEVLTTSYVCDGESGDQILVKVTDEPAGSNCINGGSKIEVGIDEDGNGTLDAIEIQTTSYICNGESDGGATYLILTGDITDAEAAAKIAREVGSNTQFVWITNTTLLTTVDLSEIETLIELNIRDNELLAEVNLNNLNSIYDESIISNSPITTLNLQSLSFCSRLSISNLNIEALDLNSLREIGNTTEYNNNLRIENNELLTSLSINQLEKGSLDIYNNSSLTTLDFSSYTDVPDVSFYISGDALTSADFSNLTAVSSLSIDAPISILDLSKLTSGNVGLGNSNITSLDLNTLTNGGIRLVSNSLMTSFSANNLTQLKQLFISDNTELTAIDLPNATKSSEVAYELYIDLSNNPKVTSIDLRSLDEAVYFYIYGMDGLVTIDLSSVTAFSDQISISGYPDLETIRLDNLISASDISISDNTKLTTLNLDRFETAINGQVSISNNTLLNMSLPALVEFSYLSLSSNNLSTSSVNSVLARLVSVSPTLSSKYIDLSQNTPAPPTGQGLTDKATLEANGNTVNTD